MHGRFTLRNSKYEKCFGPPSLTEPTNILIGLGGFLDVFFGVATFDH